MAFQQQQASYHTLCMNMKKEVGEMRSKIEQLEAQLAESEKEKAQLQALYNHELEEKKSRNEKVDVLVISPPPVDKLPVLPQITPPDVWNQI